MLIFKSSKSGTMSDVTISALEAEIKREYEQDDARDLIRKFHDMDYGNNKHPLRDEHGAYTGEYGIYHGDVAAIFGLLKVSVKFVDTNEKELAVDGKGSGVYR
jgi:hypothetical protein